jgi:Flp pilus assembly protein TadB
MARNHRNSEWTANLELAATDRAQRDTQAQNEARARETMRRATITLNDRRRAARQSFRVNVVCSVGVVAFVGVVVWTVVGLFSGGGA